MIADIGFHRFHSLSNFWSKFCSVSNFCRLGMCFDRVVDFEFHSLRNFWSNVWCDSDYCFSILGVRGLLSQHVNQGCPEQAPIQQAAEFQILCQIKCQIESQVDCQIECCKKICQIVCQIVCQIDC